MASPGSGAGAVLLIGAAGGAAVGLNPKLGAEVVEAPNWKPGLAAPGAVTAAGLVTGGAVTPGCVAGFAGWPV